MIKTKWNSLANNMIEIALIEVLKLKPRTIQECVSDLLGLNFLL